MTNSPTAPRGWSLKDFDDLNEELDFLFNNIFKSRRGMFRPIDKGWRPLTDLYETDEEVVVIMDIAGITLKDITIHLQDGALILRGIRRELSGGGKRKYHKMEIDFGPFERRLDLPASVDPDRVTNRYNQGFLEIRLPKVKGAAGTAFEIEIK